MKKEKLGNYKVVFTREYTTISAANRYVRQYEEKHGQQNNPSDRKQFLVEKLGTGKYRTTLYNLRRKIN